jgi:hypothetical protein
MNDTERGDEAMEQDSERLVGQQKWNRQAQHIASVMWPSFIAAVIGSIIWFVFVDPELLGVALIPEREISVLTGFGICFFFFWFVAILSSGTTMLLRWTRRREHSNGIARDDLGYQSDEFNK